jgi:hypothetical protein
VATHCPGGKRGGGELLVFVAGVRQLDRARDFAGGGNCLLSSFCHLFNSVDREREEEQKRKYKPNPLSKG